MKYGFTLIELVMVIAIMSILALFIAPKMYDPRTFTIGAAADVIASDIRLTQANAMAAGASRSVTFTNNSSAYSYDVAAGGAGRTRDLAGLKAGVVATSGATFTFNSFGEPTGSGGVTFSGSSGSLTVTVEPYTGKVTTQ